ncbi:hypothetical protein ACFLY0_01710 [Patescibacteria group bacterium]
MQKRRCVMEFDFNDFGYLNEDDAKRFRDQIQAVSGDKISMNDLDIMEQVLRGDKVILSDEVAERIVHTLHNRLCILWNMLQIIFSASSLNMQGTGEEVQHDPNLIEAIEHFIKEPDGAARFRDQYKV